MCVCVCVFEREREKVRGSVCVCVCVFERERDKGRKIHWDILLNKKKLSQVSKDSFRRNCSSGNIYIDGLQISKIFLNVIFMK